MVRYLRGQPIDFSFFESLCVIPCGVGDEQDPKWESVVNITEQLQFGSGQSRDREDVIANLINNKFVSQPQGQR